MTIEIPVKDMVDIIHKDTGISKKVIIESAIIQYYNELYGLNE